MDDWYFIPRSESIFLLKLRADRCKGKQRNAFEAGAAEI